MARTVFDCDTYSYWCSEEDYYAKDKNYGRFIEDGRAYEIDTRHTPRPWLNYLCNQKIASVFANDGLGFFWYKTSLLRITKFEHPIDYQPRTFEDGREVVIEDLESGRRFNVFREAEDVRCVHRPGVSELTAKIDGLTVTMTFFVPKEDACECYTIAVVSDRARRLKLRFCQTYSIARFGIHTAEEGIPYLSVPGKDQEVAVQDMVVRVHTSNPELPVPIWAMFLSPQAEAAEVEEQYDNRPDGRKFIFPVCSLICNCALEAGKPAVFEVTSGADDNEADVEAMIEKYRMQGAQAKELDSVRAMWDGLIAQPSCEVPDRNIQNFLNVWLKNQLFTTFRYIRSGYIGYRDTLQDSWGYELIEPDLAREQILKALSYMKKDGSCPRNFSPFGFGDRHDLRNTMDSATWSAMAVCDYVKETGDRGILDEKIRFLDDEELYTVDEHLDRAFDLLYEKRGRYGMCLVCDGDWNDAIEGISKSGPAVSVWLTIAVFHAQNLLADLYRYLGREEKEGRMRDRSAVLKEAVNTHGWDGEWYIYAFTGTGEPVGSHVNKEGKVHLNSNTWAIFSGIADQERTEKIKASISKYLDTPVGPALLYPPYVEEGDQVGRIARLEPGTFENGSVYQHAVTFKIYADTASGDGEAACRTFANLLPTNPENFDARRTSEPYCTGNYYCGPTHERFGQNFFTWFTGNAAWLLRIGFDEILGVKAGFEGLKIAPKVPSSWDEFSIIRNWRGCTYRFKFQRTGALELFLNGARLDGMTVPPSSEPEAEVLVHF